MNKNDTKTETSEAVPCYVLKRIPGTENFIRTELAGWPFKQEQPEGVTFDD